MKITAFEIVFNKVSREEVKGVFDDLQNTLAYDPFITGIWSINFETDPPVIMIYKSNVPFELDNDDFKPLMDKAYLSSKKLIDGFNYTFDTDIEFCGVGAHFVEDDHILADLSQIFETDFEADDPEPISGPHVRRNVLDEHPKGGFD